jgi:hypothetical protein
MTKESPMTNLLCPGAEYHLAILASGFFRHYGLEIMVFASVAFQPSVN